MAPKTALRKNTHWPVLARYLPPSSSCALWTGQLSPAMWKSKTFFTLLARWVFKPGNHTSNSYVLTHTCSHSSPIFIRLPQRSYFKENFEFIKEKIKKASPSIMDAVIGFSVSKFCTTAHADELESFFKEHPVPNSQRRIEQIIETCRTNGLMVEKIMKSKLSTASFWQ